VRQLLFAAAREVFEERGYARSTTREIASRADVAETLLFRYFGSKANLFAETVLLPLAEFFREWVGRVAIDVSSTEGVEADQYEFTRSLYEMAVQNRGLLLTFFSTAVFEPEVLEAPTALATISDALDDLAAVTADRLVKRGVDLRGFDVPTRSRAVVGMILATALFECIMVPTSSPPPSGEHIVRQLTDQILFGGLTARPVADVRGLRRSRR
jgi:AcrR family transcriptional regulator